MVTEQYTVEFPNGDLRKQLLDVIKTDSKLVRNSN